MDDGIRFEPNLFRDLSHTEDESTVAPSSSATAPNPLSQMSRTRMSENAKILALLFANNKSADHKSPPCTQLPLHMTPAASTDDQEKITHHKVTFREEIDNPAESNSSNPFLPNNDEKQNPELLSMLSSLAASEDLVSASALKPNFSMNITSAKARKRPRDLDTSDKDSKFSNGFVNGKPLSNNFSMADSKSDSIGMNCTSGFNKTPIRNIPQNYKKPVAHCTTPLSRFIEMYDHDEDCEDNNYYQAMSPTATPSPTSSKGEKRSSRHGEGGGNFFTFDSSHIELSDTLTVPELISVDTSSNHDLDSTTMESNKRQAGDCTKNKNGLTASDVGLTDILYRSTAKLPSSTSATHNSTMTQKSDVESILQHFSLTPTVTAYKGPASDPAIVTLSSEKHPIQENFNIIPSPRKSAASSNHIVCPLSETKLNLNSATHLQLPSCTSMVASTSSFAPPASLDALLQRSLSSTAVSPAQDESQLSMEKQSNEKNPPQKATETRGLARLYNNEADDNIEPTIESICRWLCEKYCPSISSQLQSTNSLAIEISIVAGNIGCSTRKMQKVFHVLDSCKVVRLVDPELMKYEWLCVTRTNLLGRLEQLFATLQAEILIMAGNADSNEFIKNVRKLQQKALIGNNSHCHPMKDVSEQCLSRITAQTGIISQELRRRLYDIASVFCGLDVLQRIPVLMLLSDNYNLLLPESKEADLKITFRWVFPLDYLSIYYRHNQEMQRKSKISKKDS